MKTSIPYFFLALVLVVCAEPPVFADVLKRPAEVPPELAFVRSLDVDGYVQSTNQNHLGAQSLWLRTRYLDPDVNAFVGLLAGVNHFNQDLRIGDPIGPETAGILFNWGADLGIVRGKHLWELDLMGATLSKSLGFAPAIVGEHSLTNHLLFYHRTVLNLFSMDAILDADQGFYWMWNSWGGVSVGYRWFTSLHMDRSGPHIGLRLRFETPKIPFVFPSIG